MENTNTLQMVRKESVFSSIQTFEEAQRMVKPLASCQFIPKAFQNRVDDCLIAMEMSYRMGISPLSVLQNIYIVYGKPAFSSKFLIALINASKRFKTGLRFKSVGKKDTDSEGVIAWVRDYDDSIIEGPAVTIGMAKTEGWYTKNGSKWPSMPQMMLQYRAASFFASFYAPDITMGIKSYEEVIDVEEVPAEKKSLFESSAPSQTPPPLPPQQKQETIEEKPQVEVEAVVCDEMPKKQTKQKDLTQDKTLFDDTDVKIGAWLRTNCLEPHTIDEFKEACQHAGVKYGAYLLDNGAQGMNTVMQYMVKG